MGVYRRPDRPYGRVNGVCVCGQSLACPVCAPRIAAKRAGRNCWVGAFVNDCTSPDTIVMRIRQAPAELIASGEVTIVSSSVAAPLQWPEAVAPSGMLSS